MAFPNFPLGLSPSPLIGGIYNVYSPTIAPAMNMQILTEANTPVQDESGTDLTIE